jgi:hypothetical protein
MLNQWVMFENDICSGCQKPIVAKLSEGKKGDSAIQIIISCDCDLTVFDEAWKNARDSGELIVVVGMTHLDMIEIVAEALGKNKP